uniref:NADH-ubiquinone oxidoreductase chain 3 n=1 Tax=Pseudacysta perseae TaxID=1041453 RepID=A0A089QFY7_PSEPZ|nr:NADH dehydrogenase subunit 3 [Pseudacysta perseae]AIR11947.1 NADH dehydrogenase subunit 3 [Pseudacysta perseae]
MMKTMLIATLTLMASTLMMLLHLIINKKMFMERNKMNPFDCGFDMHSSSRLPFSTQFFLIGILFLIFDVEMVIILPMIITLKTSNLMYWVLASMTITVILIIGLIYEWKNSVIEWMN